MPTISINLSFILRYKGLQEDLLSQQLQILGRDFLCGGTEIFGAYLGEELTLHVTVLPLVFFHVTALCTNKKDYKTKNYKTKNYKAKIYKKAIQHTKNYYKQL